MPANPNFLHRAQTFQSQLKPGQLVLVAQAANVTYLTGIPCLVPSERDAFVLISAQEIRVLHSSFTPVTQVEGFTYIPQANPNNLLEHVNSLASSHDLKSLQIDLNGLTATEYLPLAQHASLYLEPFDGQLLWSQRSLKDEYEQTQLKAAGRIAAQAWQSVGAKIQAGITERQLAQLLDAEMLLRGADRSAFPTIVAFGPHGALPHHQPTDTALENEMAVLCDFGAQVNGYPSDITRSFWFGQTPDPTYQKIEQIVMNAYDHGLVVLRKTLDEKTLTAAELDHQVRQVIVEAGYGPEYIHTTGHGIGLDIHEPPSISSRNSQTLAPSMAITVEPGIYLDGQFGFRYENSLLLTDKEIVTLTTA